VVDGQTAPVVAGMRPTRLFPPDALRGLIMVLMALDHANCFVAQRHSSGEYWDGPFPTYTDTLSFLTRFVTHFCAPGFFFLMGVGMVLLAHSRQARGESRWAITGHFWLRGAVLIALKFLVINRAWQLAPGWDIEIYIGVLFALGGTMILGSLLLWLKPAYLLGGTILLTIGTELLTPSPDLWNVPPTLLARLFLVPGGDAQVWSNYPILPWLPLVTCGMFFGHGLLERPQVTWSRVWRLGLMLLAGFLVVRGLNGFGNLRPRAGNTWIDFLNVVKYPPSIAFILLTMGINLILLGVLARVTERGQRFLWPLVVLGRVPLFFYVLHLFVYAGLGHLFTPQGTPVLAMYPYWLLGVLILFPLCWGYGGLKQRWPARLVLQFL